MMHKYIPELSPAEMHERERAAERYIVQTRRKWRRERERLDCFVWCALIGSTLLLFWALSLAFVAALAG